MDDNAGNPSGPKPYGGNNWWEGPPPAWYTGAWPQPLPPGAHYGQAPGSIEYGPGGSGTPAPPTGLGAPSPSYTPGDYTQTPPPPDPTSGGSTSGNGAPQGPAPPPPWTEGPWTPPKPTPLPGLPKLPPAPTFKGPGPFSYADFDPGSPFTQPDASAVANDPGHQFRLEQGTDALQRWAASKGTAYDSSTAKALTDYGQNLGTQDYQNVWDRAYNTWGANLGQKFQAYTANRSNALDTYNTNYGTQFKDPYTFNYQRYVDTVQNPALHQHDLNAANVTHQNDVNNTNSWNNYQSDWNQWTWQQNNWLDRVRLYGGLN